MRMKIEIDFHVPEDYWERETGFIEGVIALFREKFPDRETDYRPDGTPQVTVSYWNEDGTPREI